MSKVKAKNLRDQSSEELDLAVDEARKELFELRNQRSATKKLESPHLINHAKHKISVLLTLLNEKKNKSGLIGD